MTHASATVVRAGLFAVARRYAFFICDVEFDVYRFLDLVQFFGVHDVRPHIRNVGIELLGILEAMVRVPEFAVADDGLAGAIEDQAVNAIRGFGWQVFEVVPFGHAGGEQQGCY